MGGPRRREETLSFREQLQVAEDELQGEDEDEDKDEWTNLALFQRTIEALVREKDKTKSSQMQVQSLKHQISQKDVELGRLRRQLQVKEERAEHLQKLNEAMQVQFDRITAFTSTSRSNKCDQGTQVEMLTRSHKIYENPPRLSPAVTPRSTTTPGGRAHVEHVEDDLEVPSASSRLPQQRSMSPYNQSPPGQERSPSRFQQISSPARVYPSARSPLQLNLNRPVNGICKGSLDHFDFVDEDEDGQPSPDSGSEGHDDDPEEMDYEDPDVEEEEEEDSSSESGSSSSSEDELPTHCESHDFLYSPPPEILEEPIKQEIKEEDKDNKENQQQLLLKEEDSKNNNTAAEGEKPKKRKKPKLTPEQKAWQDKRVREGKEALLISEEDCCMTTRRHYYIGHQMEDRMEDLLQREADEGMDKLRRNFVEVPKWREIDYKALTPPPSTEASLFNSEEEEVTEAAFLRRHLRLEADEKRRKRWDSQRVREETYLERLKRRMEEREKQKTQRKRAAAGRRMGGSISAPATKGDGGSDDEHDVVRVHPEPQDIMYVRVSEEIPISIFGFPLPITRKADFELPWTPPEPVTPPTPPPSIVTSADSSTTTTTTNNASTSSTNPTPQPSIELDTPDSSSSSSTPSTILLIPTDSSSSPSPDSNSNDRLTAEEVSSSSPPSPEDSENNPPITRISSPTFYLDLPTTTIPSSSSSSNNVNINNSELIGNHQENLLNTVFVRR